MSSPISDSGVYSGPQIYPQAFLLSILAVVACLISIPPLILQIKHKNLPVTTLLLASLLMNIQNMTNPIIWPNDNIPSWPSGKILCDIEAKLQVGLSSIPSSSATCICHQLATLLSPSRATTIHPSSSSTRKRLAVEITLCILLPIYLMSVHILVQRWRYYIWGISGCFYSLDRCFLTWILILIWPVLVNVAGTAYSVLIIVRLIRHQRQVSSLLNAANVSKARFARVFALASVLIVVYMPLLLYLCVENLDSGLREWSWKIQHPPGWSETIIMIESNGQVRLDTWMQVASGYALFAVFGLGGDAMAMYRGWARAIGLQKLWIRVRSTRTGFDETEIAGRQEPDANGQRTRLPTLHEMDQDLEITIDGLGVEDSGKGG